MSLENIEDNPSVENPEHHRLSPIQLKALDDAESLFEMWARGKACRGCLLTAAEKGHAVALGYCFWMGIGITSDLAKARGFFARSADRGHPAALLALGKTFRVIDGQISPHAWALFRRSAAAGYAPAYHYIGECIMQGAFDNIELDDEFYLEQSAAMGNIERQEDIGRIKELSSNFDEALKWYRIGASNGYGPCFKRLSKMFAHGRGVPVDPIMARLLYEEQPEVGRQFDMTESQETIYCAFKQGSDDALEWMATHHTADIELISKMRGSRLC